jgi:hypothetical protein
MAEDFPVATMVGKRIILSIGQNRSKWDGFVNGNDGFLYGIPYNARRVVKFNPVDKSMKMIGPILGENDEWCCGILAKGGLHLLPTRFY